MLTGCWLAAAFIAIFPPRTPALSSVIDAVSPDVAVKVTSPACDPLPPAAVTIASSCSVIDCAVNVMSPESPTDRSLRCALASAELLTTRLDTVLFAEMVILLSASSVRLPAFQLVPAPSDAPPSPDVSRNKSLEIMMFSGSIRIWPFVPDTEDADSFPPANSTVPRAENSTNPASPLLAFALTSAP